MISKAKMRDAIDDAFIDRVKFAFNFLAGNEATEDPAEAQKQFEKQISNADDAHTRAMAFVERVFAD